MGWKIVEISTDDHISLYLNNLLIKRDEKKLLINITDIDMLILDNYKLTLSVQLINAITKNNGIIITFDTNHEPSSFIYAVQGNHNSLKVLAKQLEWNNVFKGNLWKQIIRNKVYAQYDLATKLVDQDSIDYDYFQEIFENIKEFDVTNREGHFAKVYWHSMFGVDFIRDYSSEKNATINSMLNFGYAILRAMVIKSIIKKGLDPRIAVFHKSFSNFYALASDFMEPFRVLVDKIVYENKDNAFFTSDTKKLLIKVMNERVKIANKEEFLNNAIDKCIDSVINGNGWPWVDIWK